MYLNVHLSILQRLLGLYTSLLYLHSGDCWVGIPACRTVAIETVGSVYTGLRLNRPLGRFTGLLIKCLTFPIALTCQPCLLLYVFM